MKKYRVVYILPSRYDEDGYVMRYWRGILPSNTLSCLRSLTVAVGDAWELGENVHLSVETYDDTVQRVPVDRIVRSAQRDGARLVVGLVGVQSNQFMRASDIAKEFRAHGVPVMIGGFHVSGILAMFGEPSPEMRELMDLGVTMVRGEVDAPGVLGGILRDAFNGSLEPIYNVSESPDLYNAPIPLPDTEYQRKFALSGMRTIDTSRGCPFNCSFCTVINVQGRKMRHRSPACILESIENNYDGKLFYFFTDDNLARNPSWEELFDGLKGLRDRGLDVNFMMQVDTQSYKIPRFVEKAKAAGCNYAFIGLETVNAANIKASGKAQNKVADFAHMVEVWHRADIVVHCGYIIGFPHDTVESVRRDVAVLRDDVKIDEATFFVLTPLPGSRDHKNMVEAGVPMDADLNSFDSFHETYGHPHMKGGAWTAAYREAWEAFYSKENMVNTLLRVPRDRYWQLFRIYVWYRYCTHAKTHPMITGLIRLKDRKARRPFFPRESRLRYAWRRAWEMADEARTYASVFLELQEVWMLTRPKDDPRWATLAELRSRCTDLRNRLRELELGGHYEEAAQELRSLLDASAKRLRQLSEGERALRARARKRLARQAHDVEVYLQRLESSMPDWESVRSAQRYVSDSLVAGYEDIAIRYVAKRRRFNEYRRDLIQRLKRGRLAVSDLADLPRALIFELMYGLRFSLGYISHM